MKPGERLYTWRKENNLSSETVSKEIGLKSSSMLRNYEKGLNNISDKYLIGLNEKYGISIDWLLTGNEPGETKKTIPDQYKDIMDIYDQLPADKQKDLLKIAKALLPADEPAPGQKYTNSEKAS